VGIHYAYYKRGLFVTSHAAISKSKKRRSFKKPLVLACAFLLVFALGINIGNGRIVLQRQGSVAKNLPANLDYTTVEAVYDKLRMEYDGELDQQSLLDGLKQGLATATGDPYTEYFNPKDAKAFDDELNGSFTGIGAELGKSKAGGIEIISPIAGFPAEKAGLKAKDAIVEIDGESTSGLTISQAVDKIRGDAGTKVKLKIVRNNSQELDFEITRAEITVPSVKYEILEGNIGLLTISRFGPDTAALTKEAAVSFKKAGVKGIVVDVRGNPGGLLDAAVDVSGLWLDKSQVVLQEKRDSKVIKSFYGKDEPILKGIKTVVLINEGSASASEITAGALKDNKVATLIGTKSYGKGSVQQLQHLSDGSLLKITSAHWFTPSGAGIDTIGIAPDQKIEFTEDDAKNDRDPQKDAALVFVKK
jgi:carboxyl-terminal processing protease